MNSQYIKKYFHFECNPIANPESIVHGDKYRFTILTDRLIRMEYSTIGQFEDRASQTFWFRNQPKVEYRVSNEGTYLLIETECLKLKYLKEKKFSPFTLSIRLKQMNKTWFYGQHDFKNLRGTARTLDGAIGPIPLEKGLMSRNGFSVYDDSTSLVFSEEFWLTQRGYKCKDLYFFGYGRDYLTCLSDFYKVSGKTPMIPRFILGNWWSRYWEYTEDELKVIISTYEKHGIPLSVCIIDMDWHLVKIDKKYGSGWTGYTWNKELFPNPKRILRWLKEKDLKIALNIHPALGIRGHEDCYEAVADFMGVDKEKEEPVEFDISDPKFVSVYFDVLYHPQEETGIDFWWVDWQQGFKSSLTGLDPLWMLNHLHFYDLGRNGVKRPFIFSRWGKRGNHRYPIGFSGDTFATWASLKFQPYFTSTASNIGFGWWSHDIGGHMHGKEDAELYLRWVQLGVFSPIMRLHSTKNEFLKREPWKYDSNTLEHAGNIMRYRHHLIPYIYSMAYRNFEHNIPFILPLYYMEPNNPKSYRHKQAYWYGSEMVVYPIVKKMNRKANRVLNTIYLPQESGPFFNLFTQEYHEGGKIFSRVYDISDIPVFVKAGGIIPLSEDSVLNKTGNPEAIKIEIFPGSSNEFHLYEDEGNTVAYKNGDNYITKFVLEWEGIVKFSIDKPEEMEPYIPENRKIILCFNTIENPENISVKSERDVPHEILYQADKHRLLVQILTQDFTHLDLSFDRPNIIKKNTINEEAYQMLFDSRLHIMQKSIIQKRFFKENKFDTKKLKKLYRTITFGF